MCICSIVSSKGGFVSLLIGHGELLRVNMCSWVRLRKKASLSDETLPKGKVTEEGYGTNNKMSRDLSIGF